MKTFSAEEIQKLSIKQLQRALDENQKSIDILHQLIESHQRIVKFVEPFVDDPCRQAQKEANETCVKDFTEALDPFFEELEKISSEIVKRKMKSISSPFEILGFSSYISYDLFQIFYEYIVPFFEIFQIIYPLIFMVCLFRKIYVLIFKVKNFFKETERF